MKYIPDLLLFSSFLDGKLAGGICQKRTRTYIGEVKYEPYLNQFVIHFVLMVVFWQLKHRVHFTAKLWTEGNLTPQ